jgi:thymidylate synthase (FAD)
VPYLTAPHVVLLASTSFEYATRFFDFLTDYDPDFTNYYNEDVAMSNQTSSDLLPKVAGQLCYLSFGPNRTHDKDTARYLTNIKSQAHGSVLEHASATFLCYGISRSLTHELVRHRHASYSQVSQRYVAKPRFVERPEFQTDEFLHNSFILHIEAAQANYNTLLVQLEVTHAEQHPDPNLPRTERLKAVRQAARSALPNCTEAPIIVTANMRAWRHFLEQRASSYAEIEIRRLAIAIYDHLKQIAPVIFDDYELTPEPPFGPLDWTLTTPYRKV